MTSRDFCFWLQGFMELTVIPEGTQRQFTDIQVGIISKHLRLVFKHEIDPSFKPTVTTTYQNDLNAIHASPAFDGTADGKVIARC